MMRVVKGDVKDTGSSCAVAGAGEALAPAESSR